MAELNLSRTSTTDFGANMNYVGGASDYFTGSKALDYNEGEDVYVDFPQAVEYFGYYKRYGQLKKAIDTLWIYVIGKGFETDTGTKVELEFFKGIG
jgi:hypothetical protein